MESVFQELAQDMSGKAVIGIVHEAERGLFQSYNIRLLPTMILFRNGEIAEEFKGFRPKELLMDALNK